MSKYLRPRFPWASAHTTGRPASSKAVVPITNRLAAPRSSEENADSISRGSADSSSFRYNVVKDRSATCKKFIFDRRNVQKKLAGLQDEYDILPPAEEPPAAKAGTCNKLVKAYRTFAASTTYKNVTLPLKSSKLASPFPEPVKLMPSHQISDQEKADQMQAEFRTKFSSQKS